MLRRYRTTISEAKSHSVVICYNLTVAFLQRGLLPYNPDLELFRGTLCFCCTEGDIVIIHFDGNRDPF